MSTSPDVSRLSRVVLTGGGSMLRGLPAQLGFELRLPVHPGGLWPGLPAPQQPVESVAEDGSGRQLAVAFGLAMGRA